MADVKISALGAASALDGTELFAGVQSSTTKKVTADQLATHIVDILVVDASITAPATTYNFLAENAGTEIRMDLDAVGDYIGDYLANGVGAVTPVVTDHVMLNDAGVLKKVLVSALNTKMLDGSTDASATLKASIRDISGLTVRSLDGTEHILTGEGSTPKRALLSSVAAYVHAGFDTYLNGLDTVTIADADLLYVYDSGTGKKIAASALATYVEGKVSANVCADVWDNAGAAQAPVDADVFVMEVSGARYQTTATQIATYVAAEMAGADAVDPVASGDDFLLARSGVAKTADIDTMAGYIGDYLANGVSAVTPLATDHVMLNNAGVMAKVLVSALATKILDGTTAPSATLQAAIFELSGLAAATPAGTEYVLLDDGGTPKQKTLDQIATFIHGDTTVGLAAYVDGTLANVDPVVDTDEFFLERAAAGQAVTAAILAEYIEETNFLDHTALTGAASTDLASTDQFIIYRSGVTDYYRATIDDINTYVQAALAAEYDPNWDEIDTNHYTSKPFDTDTLSMSNTSLMAVGLPVKYTIGAVDYFGIISAVSASTSIDIRGASLSGDVTALYVGPPSRVVTKEIKIPGSYLIPWNYPDDTLTDDILEAIGGQYIEWEQADAYLVSFSALHRTADGVAQPHINVKLGGSAVSTENTNKGLQLSTGGTWVRSSAVAISTSNYKVEQDEAIEVLCTAVAGTDGAAENLSLVLVFVLE